MVVLGFVFFLQALAPATQADVRRGGDDGLSNRLRDSTEVALASDPADDAHLVVIFEGHAGWQTVGGRMEVRFAATVARGDRRSRVEGRCWNDELQVCAGAIVEAAKAL
jgi:hypothetical protein